MRLVGRLVPKLLPYEKERALKRGIAQAAAWGLTSVHQAGIDEEELEILGASARGRAPAPRLRGPARWTATRRPDVLARQDAIRRPSRLGPPAGRRREGLRGRRRRGPDGGDVRALRGRRHRDPGAGRRRSSTGRWRRTTRRDGRSCSTRSATGGSTWPSPPSSARRAPTARPAGVTASSTSRCRGSPTFPASRRRASSPPPRRCSPTRGPTTPGVYLPTLGPERGRRAMPFKSIDDAGAVQAFGSDWPVFTAEVVRGIACAVTRTTVEGTPAGGWEPSQRLTAEAALRHFTRDAAFAEHAEGQKGTLAPGKLRRPRGPLPGPPRRPARSGSRTRRSS